MWIWRSFFFNLMKESVKEQREESLSGKRLFRDCSSDKSGSFWNAALLTPFQTSVSCSKHQFLTHYQRWQTWLLSVAKQYFLWWKGGGVNVSCPSTACCPRPPPTAERPAAGWLEASLPPTCRSRSAARTAVFVYLCVSVFLIVYLRIWQLEIFFFISWLTQL